LVNSFLFSCDGVLLLHGYAFRFLGAVRGLMCHGVEQDINS
jgi:hypothetical protein